VVGHSLTYLAQVTQAFFLACPTETGQCAVGRYDGTPRIFLISQRDPRDHLPVGRFDDVHDLSAMGFNERSINVVRRECLNRVGLHDCFDRVFSLCENFAQNGVTTRVNEFHGSSMQVQFQGNLRPLR
jgi:hypothetical protein